jgi:hypothetical protein
MPPRILNRSGPLERARRTPAKIFRKVLSPSGAMPRRRRQIAKCADLSTHSTAQIPRSLATTDDES